MVIKMLEFWTLEKGYRYTKSSLKHSVGCTYCSPSQRASLLSLPPLALAVLMPPCNVWVGHSLLTLLFSTVLRILCKYLNLKIFHSYSLKECESSIKNFRSGIWCNFSENSMGGLQPMHVHSLFKKNVDIEDSDFQR